ncbi:UNVERIFIED_CONTAM: dolichol-phosphate mannosyltransferase [Acetivibrio alkalicellulosi]
MESYLISIVIPVYNEGKQIFNNIDVIKNTLLNHKIPHEIILIDDGSIDNTWTELKRLSSQFPNIRGFRLSRNFGKEFALWAGIDAVGNNPCIVMDSDLQHPPEIIPEMIRLWKDEGYEVVEGVKSSRGQESIFSKFSAKFFYFLLKKLSGYELNNASDYKLLDTKVLNSLKNMQERNTFFRALSAWVGYKRTSVSFEVAERTKGTSKWSKIKLFKLAITAITSFSSLPLHIVTILGSIFCLAAIVLSIHTLYFKIRGIAAGGFATVILLQLIIGGLLMVSLGIIGTYIARIFDEIKLRPRYIITEQTIDNNKSE